jgi:hypothetical protein
MQWSISTTYKQKASCQSASINHGPFFSASKIPSTTDAWIFFREQMVATGSRNFGGTSKIAGNGHPYITIRALPRFRQAGPRPRPKARTEDAYRFGLTHQPHNLMFRAIRWPGSNGATSRRATFHLMKPANSTVAHVVRSRYLRKHFSGLPPGHRFFPLMGG